MSDTKTMPETPTLVEMLRDNKDPARLAGVTSTTAYYRVWTDTGHWEFPVPVADMGHTRFAYVERRGLMMKWIRKAIESDSMIWVGDTADG